MKKYLLLGFFAILGFSIYMLPSVAKAEESTSTVPSNVYFFGDGKGYNVNGDQMYYCFADLKCYNLEGVFAFVRELPKTITDLQNQVTNLQNQVNQLQSQPVGMVEVPSVPVTPPDTTAPVVVYVSSMDCGEQAMGCIDNSWGDDRLYIHLRDVYEQMAVRAGLGDSRFSLNIVTNEPTSLSVVFHPSTGDDVTFNSNNLVAKHIVNYADVPLPEGIYFTAKIYVTDASGNKTESSSRYRLKWYKD